MPSSVKNKIGSGLALLASTYLAAFIALIFLVRPFWTDTNNFLAWALGPEWNWVVIILILSFILTLFHIRLYIKTKNSGEAPGPLLWTATLLTLIIWTGMTILLLSELGREQAIILINLLNNLPLIILSLFMILCVLILPRFPFWGNLKLRAAVLAAAAALYLILASQPGPLRITAGPYLQAPSENSMTIMWTCNRNVMSWVEYGDDFEMKAFPQEDGLIHMNKEVQKVRLGNLTPGTEYKYRVVSREIKEFFPYSVLFGKTVKSDAYSFRTFDRNKESISFLVINDLHEKHEYWKDITAGFDTDPVDFIVLNGDYFNDLNDRRQLMNSLIKPATRYFASEIPFLFVRGNHETRGVLARDFRKYIDLPDDKYYYALNHGPLSMMAIDAGEDKEDSHREYSGMVAFDAYREEETLWMEETIQEEDWLESPWRIGFSHIPLNQFSLKDGEYKAENVAYQREWTSLLTEGHLDLMLSGHTHRWRIHPPSGEVPYPLIIGGGHREEENDFVVVRVDLTRDEIIVNLQNQKGESIDKYRIEK